MSDVQHTTSTDLVIGDIVVFQDAQGRYNLNTLHYASGAGAEKRPSDWLRRKTTKALLVELEQQVVNLPLEVVHGGDRAGTYAHELLAVEYAGWISPSFRLKVNQAFIDKRTDHSRLPAVKNPLHQMMIDMVVRLDTTEQRALQAEQTAQEAQQTALQAQQHAFQMWQNQQWVTIRQYVAMQKIERQLPEGKIRRAYGLWLTKYCKEHGDPVYDATPVGMHWETEHLYPIWAIQQTLASWLARYENQGPITGLQIEEDGVRYAVRPRKKRQ